LKDDGHTIYEEVPNLLPNIPGEKKQKKNEGKEGL